MINTLTKLINRIVPALSGGGATGSRGGRRGTAAAASGDDDAEESGQALGLASLTLRNSYHMAIYLLFSAAYPAEEIFSSLKQVRCARQSAFVSVWSVNFLV